jgi:histidinol phosphatase-like enzyme
LQNKSNRGFPWSVACFHGREEGCTCRKPLTGLWDEQIRPMFDRINTSQSWFVDHHFENLEVGRKAGLNLAWITHTTDDVREPLDYDVFGSLHHFAETLLQKKIAWIAHPVSSRLPHPQGS